MLDLIRPLIIGVVVVVGVRTQDEPELCNTDTPYNGAAPLSFL
jgi:hypothetical protein